MCEKLWFNTIINLCVIKRIYPAYGMSDVIQKENYQSNRFTASLFLFVQRSCCINYSITSKCIIKILSWHLDFLVKKAPTNTLGTYWKITVFDKNDDQGGYEKAIFHQYPVQPLQKNVQTLKTSNGTLLRIGMKNSCDTLPFSSLLYQRCSKTTIP